MKNTKSSEFTNQNLPKNSFNDNLTAIPKGAESADDPSADPDLAATTMDYGDMNTKDAKESGYINEKGQAVEKARADKIGHPTGAYTDIGEGRSGVVKPEKNKH